MPQKLFKPTTLLRNRIPVFNYREILDAVILHWHWFAISIIGCLFVAFYILGVNLRSIPHGRKS